VTGYLRTWSATQRYEAALAATPEPVREELAAAWDHRSGSDIRMDLTWIGRK
jgi:hypothetical protein